MTHYIDPYDSHMDHKIDNEKMNNQIREQTNDEYVIR